MNNYNLTMSIDALLKAAEYLDRRDREAEHGYASTFPMPDDLRHPQKRPKTKKTQGNRTSHNELEKNRRAHLRNCLEKLKEMVPLGPEASRHTTLGLLTKAKRFIKNLEDRDRKHSLYKEQLSRERRYLRRRLGQLSGQQQTLSKQRSLSECSSSTISSSHSTTSHSSTSHSSTSHSSTSQSSTSQSSTSQSSTSHSSTSSPISETGESGYSSSIPSPMFTSTDHAYHKKRAVFKYPTDEVDVIGYTSTQSDTDDHSSVRSASSDSGVTMSTSRLTLSEMRDAFM